MKIAKHWLGIAYCYFSLNISLLAMLFLESFFWYAFPIREYCLFCS